MEKTLLALRESQKVVDRAVETEGRIAYGIARDVSEGFPTGGRRGKDAKAFREARFARALAFAIWNECAREHYADCADMQSYFPARSITDALHRAKQEV